MNRLQSAAIDVIGLFLIATAAAAFAQSGPTGPSRSTPNVPSGSPVAGLGGPAHQKVSDAKPGDIRVLATAALIGQLEPLRAQAEKVIGHKLVIEYGSARGNLKNQIEAGEEFEVAILLPDVNAELLRQDKIIRGEHELARVEAAISLRGEGVKVDVSTPAALKQTLLNATSVSYSPTGAAHDTVVKLLSDLGIGDAIKDSSRGPPGQAVPLQPGQYEIGIYPLSEVVRNARVQNLGPVIVPFQVPASIEAVIGKHANDRRAAEALIRFLEGPAIDAALSAGGMIKGKGG